MEVIQMRKYNVGDIVHINKRIHSTNDFEMIEYKLLVECDPNAYGIPRWLVVAEPKYLPELREDQKIYICEEDYFDYFPFEAESYTPIRSTKEDEQIWCESMESDIWL
jgi:hypothetical protein